jgi:hypothetical protein
MRHKNKKKRIALSLAVMLPLLVAVILAILWQRLWWIVPNARVLVSGKATPADVFCSQNHMYMMCSHSMPASKHWHAYLVQPRKNEVWEVSVGTPASMWAQTNSSSWAHIAQWTDFVLLPGVAYCRAWPPDNATDIGEPDIDHFDPQLVVKPHGCAFSAVVNLENGKEQYITPHVTVRW